MRWVLFQQGMLQQQFRAEARPSQQQWEKMEKKLLGVESKQQEQWERKAQERDEMRECWRLEVQAEGGMWERVESVRWGCKPQVSRALARSLGVAEEVQEVALKVRAVQHGLGQSALQLWSFSVIEDTKQCAEEWIVVQGKGLEVVRGDREGRAPSLGSCGRWSSGGRGGLSGLRPVKKQPRSTAKRLPVVRSCSAQE